MGEPFQQAKSIFLAAIEDHAPAERLAFLEKVCCGDAGLRAEVDKLLHAHSELGSFHESPRQALPATVDNPISERPGTLLGPYKLLEQIGEGGFGIVFTAEQMHPVRRKVALKVLKPGMDTRQVVARFEAERQALALMDHPNIAKVLDAGTTGEGVRGQGSGAREAEAADPWLLTPIGRPYFVMELIKGLPITEHCEQARLTPRQRLELFVSVCQAVKHAHQKGIIHRDLKPSNVLVTVQDGKPLAKVIDFGIAKALGQQLTDKSVFTGFAQMIGTPMYMSPEQAALSNVDVDTRSDIYSLGVLLYELLTGTTPFDKERFRELDYDEMRRIIRDVEPPAPSSRLRKHEGGRMKLKDEAGRMKDEIKATKRTSWDWLAPFSSFIPHPSSFQELDWIVMKALDKDRNRRYESASAFAADVRHYLQDEPVQACPPSARYRLGKFVQRNKTVLATTGMALLLIVLLGVGVGCFFAWRSHEAEQQRTREEEIAAEKRRAAIERGMSSALGADLAAAEKAVAEAELLGASAGETRLLRGFIALFGGRPAEAVAHLKQAALLMPESVSARSLLAFAHGAAADWPAHQRVLQEALALEPHTPEDKLFLGNALGNARPAEGLPLVDQALSERPSGIAHVLRADIRHKLAEQTGAAADAEAALLDAEVAKRVLPGNVYSLTVDAKAHLTAALAYRRTGPRDRVQGHLEAAGRDADALKILPHNYRAVTTRHSVAMVRDGLASRVDMLAALRQARARSPEPALAFCEAYDLFCLGRDAEAEKVADDFPRDRLTGHVRFLAALGMRDGHADALQTCHALTGQDRLATARLEAAPLLFAVGRPEEVSSLARELRSHRDQLRYGPFNPTDIEALLTFLEGTASETEFLGHPASNESERGRQHYVIGWKRLGAGDRAGAMAAFQKAYESTPFENMPWWMARALLIRMRDPGWPRAIPRQ